MADNSYGETRVYREQGAARLVVQSGASLDVESGGEIDVESGGSLKLAGTAVTSTAAELNALDGITSTVAELNILDGVTSTAAELDEYVVSTRITDISTGASYWAVAPHAGDISKVWTVLHGVIATADAVVTLEIGGTLVTDSTVTIAYSGSAAGDVDSSTPSAANTVTAGQAIEVITSGASTNAIVVDVYMVISR